MADVMIVIAATLILAGLAALAVIIVATVGIRREEKEFQRTGVVSLTQRAPTLISSGTRSLAGVYVRQRADTDPCPVMPWEDLRV
jgi:hypothetical protein